MSFTVYRSSAGSGKTYTLVREYLKILLEDTGSFRNILAVTFTNKAAAEMKQRVLRSLEELSGLQAVNSRPVNTLLTSLMEESGLDETEISLRSAEALKNILHCYSDFSICTIDSFSHRIIRAFAHDFGLPMNFKVELDTEKLMETAVDLLLDKAGEDEQLTALLVNFLESNIEDDKSWAIDKSLMEFSELLLDEESQLQLPKLRNLSVEDFRRFAGFTRNKTREFEKVLSGEAGRAWKAICDAGLDHQAFANGRSGISWYFEQIAGGRTDKLQPSPKLSASLEKESWSSAKATSEEKKKTEELKPLLLESFQRIQQVIGKDYKAYRFYKLLSKSIYPMALLNTIGRIFQDFKTENNLIHISEFNSRIAKIVMGEPVPFIYERTGEKYHHILIDEFQDTSALQWQNFVPLIENSLASGFFNLVVGDGKQAIYRWRNGDVEQFTSLPELKGSGGSSVLKEREDALRRNFDEKKLDTNFRSCEEIVSFNNDLFGFASGFLDESRKKVYAGHAQVAGKPGVGGYVKISFTGRSEGEPTAASEKMMNDITEIIAGCLSDGYNYKDIAVLCRVNREASQTAQMLIGKNIPVVSGESLLLMYSPVVRMLIGLARYLYGPVNPVLQAEVLNHYCELHPTELPFYRSWLNMANNPEKRTGIFDGFLNEKTGGEGMAELRTLPVYDLFVRLVKSFCPLSAPDPYVQFFLSAILKFGSGKSSSAPDFLDWWDDHSDKLSVQMPSALDAVQVMTIHKAKGLQFPVVIYPFAGDKLKHTKKYLWVDLDHDEVPGLPSALIGSGSELEETAFAEKYTEERQKSLLDLLNVLYVVLTRPEQRLYILPPLPPVKTGEINSVPTILKTWLEQKGLWEEDRFEYEFGSIGKINQAKREEGGILSLPGMLFGEWREKIRIRSQAPEIWNFDDPDRNRRFGNVLHTILAGLDPGTGADEMISRMLENGLLDRAWENEVRSKIREILEDPELAFIFKEGTEVRPEAEILTPEGHSVRPDRVIIRADQTIVVDYKTGRPMEKYASQLKRYAGCLEEMGYRNVRKYLLYLEPAIRLEEVA